MVTKGLFVRLEAKEGKANEIESFLASVVSLVKKEPATKAWFANRFGPSHYGIIDMFDDEAGRDAHLNGEVAKGLMQVAPELFSSPPEIQKIDILASKLPAQEPAQPDTKGILLTFKGTEGKDEEVIEFLKETQPLAMEEEQTTAWFAIRLPNNEYGIFDVFPDNNARLKHIAGRIPKEVTKHTFHLNGGTPDMDLLKVTAENFKV